MSAHLPRAPILAVLLIGALASTVSAQNTAPAFAGITFVVATPAPSLVPGRLRLDVLNQTSSQAPPPTARPKGFAYSDAYRMRLKIHRYASFATLPLFTAQAIVGQSLATNPTDAKKTTHLILASSIGGLFAVNGVTGVWNLIEARHDPKRHTLRTVHGVLMLVASGCFFATAVSAPGSEFQNGGGSVSVHRGLAITSIGVATTGYLIMLFGK